ncbi:MAG: Mrp/NBP35 family ATP-binding protein, partial [Acutalibacter sp.]|nr:Mrp/NBP35 family ATP-binding protein [Acutalibacter sp.]
MESCTHDCSSCGADCPSRQNPESMIEKLNDLSHVKKVIGIVSGKGGVGKSLVTSMLAVTLRRRENAVAV